MFLSPKLIPLRSLQQYIITRSVCEQLVITYVNYEQISDHKNK